MITSVWIRIGGILGSRFGSSDGAGWARGRAQRGVSIARAYRQTECLLNPSPSRPVWRYLSPAVDDHVRRLDRRQLREDSDDVLLRR